MGLLNANAEFIRRSISSVYWNFLFHGAPVNRKVMIFNKHLMNTFHNYIPNKINNCSYKWPPWMTDNVKSRVRERSKITKKYYKYGKMKSHLDELEKKTDECTVLILDAKEKYVRCMSNISLIIH